MDLASRLRSRLTYPNVGVTACLLMLIALLGAGQAYAINTIRGEDVVDESLTGADIQNRTVGPEDLATDSVGFRATQFNALDGRHIIDTSLTGADIRDGTLGRDDIDYGYQVVTAGPFHFGPGQRYFVYAQCPVGTRAVGGGGHGALGVTDLTGSNPSEDGRLWFVYLENAPHSGADWYVYAICLKVR